MKFAWRISGAAYRLQRVTGRSVAQTLAPAVFATRLYGATLNGRRVSPRGFAPSESWPGDANRGAAIISGEFPLCGESVKDATPIWEAPGSSARWRAAANGFDWLRDLRAVGGDTARTAARALVKNWIDTQARWRPVPWRPDVLGARISNWIGHGEFLLAGADETFIAAFWDSIARQARHLARAAGLTPPGAGRIDALKGLVFAALALDRHRKRLRRWLARLDAELRLQILGDGGHIERSPAVQLSVLRHLVDIRAGLREAQEEIPTGLQTAIDRMAPMLRFFRHGDGGLALFNDSDEAEGWLIDVALTRAEARGKPLESAPHSGFERLNLNRTLLIMDCGRPPPVEYDRHAHAGTLSFELSVGKERMIVNCGAHASGDPAWRDAQRATAAHSTVTVEDVNSAELLPDGGLGHRPAQARAERREADGAIWIDARHDGYLRSFGLVHRRRLYVAPGGGDLRGEDTLDGPGEHKFTVRFHLHPAVRASLVQEGSGVLLRLPGGTGWRFRAGGGVTALQESVYLGRSGEVRRTEQIVVSSATQGGQGQVKWALSRVAGGGAKS